MDKVKLLEKEKEYAELGERWCNINGDVEQAAYWRGVANGYGKAIEEITEVN